MKKKIVAIGGGLIGRINSDGSKDPYELKSIDEEIIKLTNKENPKVLFLAHALPNTSIEAIAYNTFINNYVNKFNCETKILFKNELKEDANEIKKFIDWSDIIYESGGNTLEMISTWKNTVFDKMLEYAYNQGKVMCGISAGASCWFKSCLSDSLRFIEGDNAPLIEIECLNFINALFVPHSDEEKEQAVKEILKNRDDVALLIPNGLALEIVDNSYRIIGNSINDAYRVYYRNDKYIKEKIERTDEYKSLEQLL